MFKRRKKLQRELSKQKSFNNSLCEANSKLSKRVFEYRAAKRELEEKCEGVEKVLAEYLRKNEDFVHDVHRLTAERDELLRANGELEREADRQSEENARLAEQLMRMACPDDCYGHTYDAPGGSYCRACIRNPHARDKYQAVKKDVG